MKMFAVRAVSLAVLASMAGCGALETRNEVHKQANASAENVTEVRQRLRESDTQVLESVREIAGVWLGRRTIKVSREAELPAVFTQIISFQFPDRPSLTVVGDRISKIVGLPVRIAPDALVPIEHFSAQTMAVGGTTSSTSPTPTAGGLVTTTGGAIPGTPGTPVQPSMNGALGAVPSMASIASANAAPVRPFVLDLSSPYSGTLKDLLDQLAARYGVGWDFKDGVILVSRMVTRTYQIASLMDKNETRTAVTKSGSTSTASSGGGSSGVTQPGNSSASSDVSSRVESKVDVAEGLKESIEAALTPRVGKFAISSFGVVTVTDTREVHEHIRELIDGSNKAIGRQVRLRMVMVEVEASTKNDIGIDWTWAISEATRKWNVDFSAPAGMLGGGALNAGQIGVIRNGSTSSTTAFIKALGEVGRVGLKKDETYTLMNNRPLAVAQVDNYIYPARSTPGTSTSVGSTSSSSGVEPGQLTTGNFLNLRASVQPNGSVMVHFNLDTSRRGKIETFTSNGSVLQYPQSSGGNYQTYASIPNGQTGVIAVIESDSNEATDRSFDTKLSPVLGGGIYNNMVHKRMLLLLTPVVVEGAS
jgi:hypothetical protein